MADMLERGFRFLAAKQESHVSQPVTYLRRNVAIPLNATLASNDTRQRSENGSYRSFSDLDLIVRTEFLMIDDVAFEPATGDQIETADGSRFRVGPPDTGDEHCWRYTDPHKTAVRIHTKRIK